MLLSRYRSPKLLFDHANYALRTGGDAALGEKHIRFYLSRALQHNPAAEHELRRAALLEALSVNLAPYPWITVGKSLHTKLLSLDFHFRRVAADAHPTVPPHLDALLIALAANADTASSAPVISIIDKKGQLHYVKASSDGTYTHLLLDPSYKGDAEQAQSLQDLVDSIFSIAPADPMEQETQ